MAIALISFVPLLLVLLYLEIVNLRKKLDALRRQLGTIADHLGLKPNSDISPAVLGLLQADRKIEAIKVYREATGAGLAEAKEAVERMQADMDGTIA